MVKDRRGTITIEYILGAALLVLLLFGSLEMVAGLAKVKDSYNLDRLAIVAGAAALRDVAWTAQNTQRVLATRARLIGALEALSLSVLPSQSNFVLARFAAAETVKNRIHVPRDQGQGTPGSCPPGQTQ